MKEDNEKNELTPIEKGVGPALGIAGGLITFFYLAARDKERQRYAEAEQRFIEGLTPAQKENYLVELQLKAEKKAKNKRNIISGIKWYFILAFIILVISILFPDWQPI
jgi:hypothetical protein